MQKLKLKQLKGMEMIVKKWDLEEEETWSVDSTYWQSSMQLCCSIVFAINIHCRYSHWKGRRNLAKVMSTKRKAAEQNVLLYMLKDCGTTGPSIWIFCLFVIRKSGRWEEQGEEDDSICTKHQVELELQSVWNERKILLDKLQGKGEMCECQQTRVRVSLIFASLVVL